MKQQACTPVAFPTSPRCRAQQGRTWGGAWGGALKRFGRRRGSEVLEAALVFPILIGLAFGTIEFGYWFYVEHNLQAAAAAGARAGIASGLNGDGERYSEATAAAQSIMTAAGFNDAAEYAVVPAVVDHNGTEYLQVKITASWSRIGVKTVGFVRSDKIEAVATMRVEE